MTTPLPKNFKDIIAHYLNNDNLTSPDMVCHTRSKGRGGVFRIPLDERTSTIVKVWNIRGYIQRLKSYSHQSMGWREWNMHKCIYDIGIQTPKPLTFFIVSLKDHNRYEVMAIEDCGETQTGVPYLKQLISTNQREKIRLFEEHVIDTTLTLTKRKIIDTDNQLNNFITDQHDKINRIDFECAKKKSILPQRLFQAQYIEMIDRLIRSHLHATYPATRSTKEFIRTLINQLELPNKIQTLVKETTRKELIQEKERTGIDYSISY